MQQEKRVAIPLKIQLVDNWHDQWPAVLELIQRLGKQSCLQLDEDGWIPARQNLLVGFAGRNPVGFICFRVEPTTDGGKLILVALVEGADVDPDAGVDEPAANRQLRQAAMNRALELRCAKFRDATCVGA